MNQVADNLSEQMERGLDADGLTLLREAGKLAQGMGVELEAGKLAQGMGVELYLVGGPVRDLLLQRPQLDLDLVAVGDGVSFARVWAEMLSATISVHQTFLTATVTLPDGRHRCCNGAARKLPASRSTAHRSADIY